MPFGDHAYGTDPYGGSTAAAAPPVPATPADTATGYVYENVTLIGEPSADGFAYVYENVGVAERFTRSAGVLVTDGRNGRHAVAYVHENVTT